MGCSSACNLTLGKSFRGAYSHEFDHMVVKYGTGPSARRKKTYLGKKKKQASLKLCCWILVGSAPLTYRGALNLNPESVQFPAKVEETLDYRGSKGKGEWNMGSRRQSSMSFTSRPLGARMKIAMVWFNKSMLLFNTLFPTSHSPNSQTQVTHHCSAFWNPVPWAQRVPSVMVKRLHIKSNYWSWWLYCFR